MKCNYHRRLGVEIELLTPSKLAKNLGKHEPPEGGEEIAWKIYQATGFLVEIHSYETTTNNPNWVIKPDSSCGLEVCSPILKGWQDLQKLFKVIECFEKDDTICVDDSCSLHVHINTEDMSEDEVASVLSWWIKCEPIFFNSAPAHRQNNRYCQLIGSSDLFQHDKDYSSRSIILALGKTKYFSASTFHWSQRPTVEFRIAEGLLCKNVRDSKNWIRLLLHFVERARIKRPRNYVEGDRWSGLLWLDRPDVLQLLGFDQPLTGSLKEVKEWFVKRISMSERSFAYEQIRNPQIIKLYKDS